MFLKKINRIYLHIILILFHRKYNRRQAINNVQNKVVERVQVLGIFLE